MELMSSNAKIAEADLASLVVIKYPDPRLMQPSTPLGAGEIDDSVRALAQRMFVLMAEHRGVGLAAPQVGINVRMFVACPTGEDEDRRVYINPRITFVDGAQEEEEGCLSLPNVTCKIKRYLKATIAALDEMGHPFEEQGEGLVARIYQHETDHLDGRLLIDRMGSVAKLANRRSIKQLEEDFADRVK